MTDPPATEKRRGRKPANKPVAAGGAFGEEGGGDDVVKKKRGRKPTAKVITLDAEAEDFNECIIAHLKLEPTDVDRVLSASLDSKPRVSISERSAQECVIMDEYEAQCVPPREEGCATCEQLRRRISDLEQDIASSSRSAVVHNASPFLNRCVYQSRAKFSDPEGKEWQTCTDVACWWCCHTFDNVPIGIPDSYHDGRYKMFGCFCSFNCALAYNRDLRDYRTYERQSLIHHLKAELGADDGIRLDAAPPRQVLKMFGGTLDIEEFRHQFFQVDRTYTFKMPPLVSIAGIVEETSKDLPIGQKIKLSRLMDGPIIRRTKPLPQSSINIFSMIGR